MNHLYLLTIFVHPHIQTFLEPAGLTLVSMGLVHNACPGTGLASVNNLCIRNFKVFMKDNLFFNADMYT